MKADDEGGAQERRARGRKRKQSLQVDDQETAGVSGEAGSPAQEVDPITAAIDAVLANASVISTAVEKPKKRRRVKKRDQAGNAETTQKQDAKTSADNVDENDDDSSTAGGDAGSYCCFWMGSVRINVI